MLFEKKFISRLEFSKELGISLSTVDRGIRNNEWPFCNYVKIGRRVLYPVALIEEIRQRSGTISNDRIKEVIETESLQPINFVKGSVDSVRGFVSQMCKEGYFKTSLEEALGHFSLNGLPLSDCSILKPIEWGRKAKKTELCRFLSFLWKTEIVLKNQEALYGNFSFLGKQLSAADRSLAYHGDKYNQSRPENAACDDTGLNRILQDFYMNAKEPNNEMREITGVKAKRSLLRQH
jgi:predicted DNA-binding transcriptional regulator AlpA